jgi:cytochrome d ubiquinol oxidase subunit II
MEYWLPVFFVFAMGLALLIYVVLDGMDLGIGLLLPLASEDEKDIMIASIGPFWDANETWIVLGVGILLIAFPKAHGIVLTSMYLPVTLMLMGLILRGVAFDFRVKSGDVKKSMWNRLFFVGSLITTCCQGWMIGSYITGLQESTISTLFSVLIAITLPFLYVMLAAGWLLMKTENQLFDKSIRWARLAILPMGLALLLVSIATPLVSSAIADKWFNVSNALLLSPIPLISILAYGSLVYLLSKAEILYRGNGWLIYACLIVICLMATLGLAVSIFPEIVIGQLTIWQAAASTASLKFIFVGTVITLPCILAYTFYIYKIFHGKASALSYE